MQLKIKRLRPEAVLPRRATPESAGFDLCACLEEELCIAPWERVRIPTGIAMELPPETAGLVYPRSGLASKYGITLSNCVGVIDSDYRGEVQVAVVNQSDEPYTIRSGERIAQLVVTPVFLPEVVEAAALSDTVRGEGGFGSTGIQSKGENRE